MTFLPLVRWAGLAGLLWLTGCPIPQTAPPQTAASPRTASGQHIALPQSPRPAPASTPPNTPHPAHTPDIPDEPLQPITAVQASSGEVASLSAPADLWDRIRRGFAMPDLQHTLVQEREQWYAARPDYMQRTTERSSKYLFHIVEEIERRGMPTELALLPYIESAFNPQAISSAKAAGMWQFMPA